MVIYLTGPLGSKAERTFMALLVRDLERAGHTLSWPGALFLAEDVAAMGDSASGLIIDTCNASLKRCACMVAVLDGTRVGSGTAWEIGYAHAKGIPVFGLRAESLRTGDAPPPAMGNSVVHECLEGLVHDTPGLLRLLSEVEGSRTLADEAARRG